MTTPTSPAVDAGADEANGTAGARARHTFGDLFHERTRFRFIARSRRYLFISGALLVVSIVSLATQQLNLSIEFEGGTAWLIPVTDEPDISSVRDSLGPLGLGDAKVAILESEDSGSFEIRIQADEVVEPLSEARAAIAAATGIPAAEVRFDRIGDGGSWSVRSASMSADITPDSLASAVNSVEGLDGATGTVEGARVVVVVDALPETLTERLAVATGSSVAEISVDKVGPTWGERVTRKAIQALITFFVVVSLYLTFRFEWKMALAAMAAVAHDIVVTAGVYSVFQFRVTPATVTAFLTILGFSLYDTVVVFDKVSENTESLLDDEDATYSEKVDMALNQVLMRSLSTSIVAVLPVGSLLVVGAWWLGATSLADFSVALLIGLVVGTYSSLFVATPLLAAWKEREPRYRALRERREDVTALAVERRRAEKQAQRDRKQAEDAAGEAATVVSARGRRQRGRKRR